MKDEVAQGRLAAIPFAASELYRPLGIIHRKKKRFNPVAQAFLDLLREKPSIDSGVAASGVTAVTL
jgi:DNA-binding transcriptional LysR family regulator